MVHNICSILRGLFYAAQILTHKLCDIINIFESDYEQPSGKNYMPRSAATTLDREWEYQKQTPTVASSSIPPSTVSLHTI